MNTLSAGNMLVILLEQLSENQVDFKWQVASCLLSFSFRRMIVIEFTKRTTDLTHRRNVIRFSYRAIQFFTDVFHLLCAVLKIELSASLPNHCFERHLNVVVIKRAN